jgi:2-amino-4-hydroxy-6-hydroxymethyldihydropteridine diphosphokinase
MTGGVVAHCILGSNMGDRALQIRRAVFALADSPGIELVAASRLHETEPWGRADQAPYLNAAIELRTTLEPTELLNRFQAIERSLGRVPAPSRWAPRPIDLDIALYGDAIIESERLVVPHRLLPKRVFALAPLLEIAPKLRHPQSGESFADMLEALGGADPQACAPGEPIHWTKAHLVNLKDKEDGVGQPPSAVYSPVASPTAHSSFDPSFLFRPNSGAPDHFLFRSDSPEETESLGRACGAALRGGELIALAGQLGAGKTCFTRGVARGLGIREPVSSPSYVLVKSYEGRLRLHHADFYRIENVAPGNEGRDQGESPDLSSLGLEDFLEDPGAVILIEWADRFPAWLEAPFYVVQMTGSGDGGRFLLARRIEAAIK